MALDVRKFGPKSDKIGAHRGAFVYQETFKKDFATASRVINEVVLGTLSSLRMRVRRVLHDVPAPGSGELPRIP
jgi:hypothetical protein